MESSSVGRSKKAAAISPFELSFLEFCSRKRSFGEKISDSDRSYFYKCEFCPGKKLRNEDELEEHLDSFHTERTCSECGGNFMTKKAFDTHQHKKIPIGETTTNTKSDHDSPEKPSHNNGGGNDAVVVKPEDNDGKSSKTNSKDLNIESNDKIEETTKPSEKKDLSSIKGPFIFECTECQESFPTQFHLSTHIRDSHLIPQCSLPPKKRSSPLKNWSPKRDGKDEKESRKQTPPLTSTFQQQDPGEEEEIEEPYETSLGNDPKLESNIDSLEKTEEVPTKEEQSPRKRKKKTDLLPISDDVQPEAIPPRRNRARKNYTDIDLYLDESEEEAILQKILKQTSRLRRGKKSKNEHSVNNISVTKSDNESINESTNDSLHNRDSLSSTRGKRRGRCKKV
ncbi:uncharacterized protein [Lepeophtheirus salmonis]|uniref:uncharacterized protein isoform X1 n=1 Tax=Lepeophtheirus salmonis TaxID=72036 RepID=UPI001AE49258|nr:uncharacterized protein LOC121119739 isoform X1 [Lepeophtheirus salmonis]